MSDALFLVWEDITSHQERALRWGYAGVCGHATEPPYEVDQVVFSFYGSIPQRVNESHIVLCLRAPLYDHMRSNRDC